MGKYVVLGVRRYSFRNEQGQQVEGMRVTYLDALEDSTNAKGFSPLTIGCDNSRWNEFSRVPGMYDLDFRQRPDSKGKPVLVLGESRFLQDVAFDEVKTTPEKANPRA